MFLLNLIYLIGFIISLSYAEYQVDLKNPPPYIRQCRGNDTELIQCLIDSVHYLKPYLATGIPEIELPSVEPFQMESIQLKIIGGYDVQISNIDIYGASNFQISNLKLHNDEEPLRLRFHLPELTIKSRFLGSGQIVFFTISASGDFKGNFENLTANISGYLSSNTQNNLTYLHVNELIIGLEIDRFTMGVDNVDGIASLGASSINKYLKNSGRKILDAITPQLQQDLSIQLRKMANQILVHVPVEAFYVKN